jgi:uncharacterized protein YecA (UPF0149 family)
MGVIAESIAAYAQPLLDQSDGSADGMQRALTLAQVCWNLALSPEKERDAGIAELRRSLHMDDSEFEGFRQSVVMPMICRHHDMFPHMPRLGSMNQSGAPLAPQTHPTASLRTEKYPGTGRNVQCPCNSGKKYKRFCGR